MATTKFTLTDADQAAVKTALEMLRTFLQAEGVRGANRITMDEKELVVKIQRAYADYWTESGDATETIVDTAVTAVNTPTP